MSIDTCAIPHRVLPRLVERPWGGTRLPDLVAEPGTAIGTENGPVQGPRRAPAPTGRVGEAWLAGPESTVAGGPAEGTTLEELARAHGARFVGTAPLARHGERMPLLVKLLDAAEPLSVQVHPDDEHALREGEQLGKDEAWLILAAASEASVAWGWRRPVSPLEVREAAADGSLPGLLRTLRVRPDDVVVNEAGVVHAVGAGVLLYELQQASDLTYRLYDHGRVGADGRPRALHLEAAMAVARLTPGERPAPEPRELAPGRTRLATTRSFRLERWEVEGGEEQAWEVEPRSLEVWTVLDGDARVSTGGVTLELPRYSTVVLPAAVGRASWRGAAVLVRGTA